MPSTNRRRFLATVGAAGTTALAGCSAFGGGRPDVNPASGLSEDTSHALEDEAVYLAGETADLPDPPTTTDTVEDADAVLATASADRVELVRAFRAGKPVAFAREGAQNALRGLLERVRQEYTFGVETVVGRPVETVVAVPGGNGTVETYTFVAEGGWPDPVLDPFGWALVGRVPECDTFVPESSADSEYDYAGSAHVAGRLDTGETYVSRTTGSVRRYENDQRHVRLRTAMHVAANDGYAVERAQRVADFANDEETTNWFPNPHTQNGVEVSNHSDPVDETVDVTFTPVSGRTRSALTGCCGVSIEESVAYDHETDFEWKHDRLLGSDVHHGGGTGRGEWHLDG
ncbi:hypothetical protein [Halobacterium zhouii]|uniref:hypothetical protein n=1 Tax=Halobacterium zhouii TaxID=2902624 RepID=UPI001E4389F3|nr:hypothetical protein [Halobacterium zhouii]